MTDEDKYNWSIEESAKREKRWPHIGTYDYARSIYWARFWRWAKFRCMSWGRPGPTLAQRVWCWLVEIVPTTLVVVAGLLLAVGCRSTVPLTQTDGFIIFDRSGHMEVNYRYGTPMFFTDKAAADEWRDIQHPGSTTTPVKLVEVEETVFPVAGVDWFVVVMPDGSLMPNYRFHVPMLDSAPEYAESWATTGDGRVAQVNVIK